MTRKKNANWDVQNARPDGTWLWDQIKVSLLMDLRDELQALNGLLQCGNVKKMFRDLTVIRQNTNRRKKR